MDGSSDVMLMIMPLVKYITPLCFSFIYLASISVPTICLGVSAQRPAGGLSGGLQSRLFTLPGDPTPAGTSMPDSFSELEGFGGKTSTCI